jgi:hypothetical protein
MFISSWMTWRLARQHKGRSRPAASSASRRRGLRLACEQLEGRTVPSTYYAPTASYLIADIDAANLAGGANTIVLTASTTSPYVLTAADNTTDGGNGLPVIAANDILTIQGNRDIIQRSTASGTPPFRLFDVAPGASLTLANMTLQGGSTSFGGGAIFNQGTLDLQGVTVQNNIASWQVAAGGSIYSNGSLTLEAGTIIRGNQVVGGWGQASYSWNGTLIGVSGGPAYGGGLYVAGGTATLTNATQRFFLIDVGLLSQRRTVEASIFLPNH